MATKKSTPNKRGSEKQEADAQLRKVGRYLSGKDVAGSADSKAKGAQARKAALIRGVYGDVEERRLANKDSGKKKPAPRKTIAVYEQPGTVTKYGKISKGGVRIKTVGGTKKKK